MEFDLQSLNPLTPPYWTKPAKTPTLELGRYLVPTILNENPSNMKSSIHLAQFKILLKTWNGLDNQC